MSRLSLGWFLLVCSLLVLMLAAVEAGSLSGLKPLQIGGNSYGSVPGAPELSQSATIISSSDSTTTRTNSTSSSRSGPTSTGLLLYQPPISLPWWYLAVLLAAVVAVGVGLFLRRGKQAEVYDFREAMSRLEDSRARMIGSDSALRNLELMKYYTIMREICTKAGMGEEADETPSEYIGRISSALAVSPELSEHFATTFNRARYGLELSAGDLGEAASFMGSFVSGLKGRIDIG
jgi:hypothetical protein